MNFERVHFFSTHDMSKYRNMELAESILKDFDESKSFDINDIIELYQIKLFIDNEIYLAKWTSENIDQVKCTCVKMWATIVRFCAGLNSDNIETQFLQLESWTIEERFV